MSYQAWKEKRHVDELAIFGGPPMFETTLHVGRPNIGNRVNLLERINSILDNRWLTNNGPYVQEFERRIEKLLGVNHCIAMCNATVGLEITIRALGMKGEVIVPSFTFVATAHALQWQEVTPVFCDIDPDTYCINPSQVESLITPRTTGIVGVHLWGRPCDVTALADIATAHHLKIIYDAAHAFGCTCKGTMVGSFGNAEVFSFHATKFLNSLEGGAVVTNDADLAQRIRLMKNFGFHGYDNVVYLGTNGKMNEVSAAMGLTSLDSMDEFIGINHCNYCQYHQGLANVPGVRLILYEEHEASNYQYIVAEVDESVTGISRDEMAEILFAENVIARRYFYPGCHRMEPYRSYFPHAKLLLPNTERLMQNVLSLPTGTTIGTDEVVRICLLIGMVVAKGGEIRKRLQSKSTYYTNYPIFSRPGGAM